MSDSASNRRLGLLLVGAGVLAGLVVLDRARDSGEAGDVAVVTPRKLNANTDARPAETARGAGLHQLSGLRIEQLGSTVSRPLFEPSRRQVVRAQPPSAPAPTPRSDATDVAGLRLIGVVHSGNSATALIAGTSGATLRVEEGEVVAGWTVARISPSEVTLTRDGRQQVLALFRKP